MKLYIDKNIEIDTDIHRLPVDEIYAFLKTTYWAGNRSRETVERSIKHSLNIGCYLDNQLIGYARIITDYAVFAYLCDVYILPPYQGKAYGKLLMKHVHLHPQLQNIRRWMLATKDAHGLYAQFDYQPLLNPTRWMEIFNPEQ